MWNQCKQWVPPLSKVHWNPAPLRRHPLQQKIQVQDRRFRTEKLLPNWWESGNLQEKTGTRGQRCTIQEELRLQQSNRTLHWRLGRLGHRHCAHTLRRDFPRHGEIQWAHNKVRWGYQPDCENMWQVEQQDDESWNHSTLEGCIEKHLFDKKASLWTDIKWRFWRSRLRCRRRYRRKGELQQIYKDTKPAIYLEDERVCQPPPHRRRLRRVRPLYGVYGVQADF